MGRRVTLNCQQVNCQRNAPFEPISSGAFPSCPEHPMAKRVCPTAGCPNLTSGGRCPTCQAQADTQRGTATQRGYTSRGHRHFRAAVLRRDPICVLCQLSASTVADHYPTSRRDLITAGLNPNDPQHGRGLCHPCHSSETTRLQPGGFLTR